MGRQRQITFDYSENRFEEGFSRERVLIDHQTRNQFMTSPDRNGDRPMIGIQISKKMASRDDLIVENQLAVISLVDSAQEIIAWAQGL